MFPLLNCLWVNEQESKAETFEVFLCHNSVDKPAVREIARELSKENIKPWLDETDIRTGSFWHAAIGQQIESVKSAAVFVGASGVGPWQSREIIALLGEFDKRGCPVIPAILPSDPPKPVVLPWSLKGLHCVDFRTESQPLKRLIWGITGQKPAELADVHDSEKPATTREATKPRLIPPRDEPAQSENISSKARLYSVSIETPDDDNAKQLQTLRSRVTEYWVDGLLKHSLYNEVLISLGKRKIDKAIDAPWKYTVEVTDAINLASLDDRDLSVIYDATRLLLILGEPGSGKTTTMLDLARTLLERAKGNIKERVPVVLNLSSWKKKQPIAEWMSNELFDKYRVPRKIASLWLQRDYLLPFLDGLDETETSMQPDCVTAINVFIEEFQPSGLVVCCRLNEYRWLPKRLKLNGAICIEPLSSEEVRRYLAAGGSELAALRLSVEGDPVLKELAQTPLMLSIMSLAYQGAGTEEIVRQKFDSEKQRQHIFNLYVEQMFKRKGTISLGFRKEKIIGWLSWLAGKMRKHSQSLFLVEGLQRSWSDTKARGAAYETFLVLLGGLIGGLIGWGIGGLIGGQRSFTLPGGLLVGRSFGLILGQWSGLILGLAFGLQFVLQAISSRKITSVETLSWNWDEFLSASRSGPALAPGLILGYAAHVIFGNLGISLATGSGVALAIYFGAGFAARVKVDKAFPNQGIKLSLRNALVVSLVTSFSSGLIGGLIAGLFAGPSIGLKVGLILGTIVGAFVGYFQGGSAVIQHYTLRLILWLNGYTPFKFIKFLDECAKLILLKKVGGGYIFIHRMLLDYFADLSPPSTKGKDGKPRAVAP